MPCWLLVEVKIEKAQIKAFEQACKDKGLKCEGLTVSEANGRPVGHLKDFGSFYRLQLEGNYNTNALFQGYAENVALTAVQDLAGELVDRIEEPDGSLLLRVRIAEYA